MTMQIRTAAGNSRKREANKVLRKYQSSGNDRIVNGTGSGSDLTETQRRDWGTRVHELTECGTE